MGKEWDQMDQWSQIRTVRDNGRGSVPYGLERTRGRELEKNHYDCFLAEVTA